MNPYTLLRITNYLWLVFLLAWIVFALRQKELKTKESVAERLSYTIPTLGAFLLLFEGTARYGWLEMRFVERSSAIGLLGVVLTAAGIGFAIWARYHLGENWSGIVSIREGHELIGTGPYRWIRHPIYTGMFLGVAGTALALGEIRGLLAFAILFVAFYVKARKEEAWLTREFGERFAAHAKRTGMFLPRWS